MNNIDRPDQSSNGRNEENGKFAAACEIEIKIVREENGFEEIENESNDGVENIPKSRSSKVERFVRNVDPRLKRDWKDVGE